MVLVTRKKIISSIGTWITGKKILSDCAGLIVHVPDPRANESTSVRYTVGTRIPGSSTRQRRTRISMPTSHCSTMIGSAQIRIRKIYVEFPTGLSLIRVVFTRTASELGVVIAPPQPQREQ